jgi:hypothetical protein
VRPRHHDRLRRRRDPGQRFLAGLRRAPLILVAITRLATTVEEEARALAHDLGTVPYEQKLKLNAGVPTIVLATTDPARATALLDTLRLRGHDVLRCESDDVVAGADMVAIRRCRFEADALIANDTRLAWSDVAALVRATHRRSTESTDDVKQSKFSLGRAVLTGGLVMKKTTIRKEVKRVDEVEPVLYLFSRSGGVPWLWRERQLRYDALGDDVSPTSSHNFIRLVDALRTRARGAAFDDRLVARRNSPDEVDVLAHLIASSIEVGASPFR